MFDAFLPRIRRFGSSNVIRNVSHKSDLLAAADVRDSEIGVAAEIGLHLDEISAMRNQSVNIFSGLGGIGDDQ